MNTIYKAIGTTKQNIHQRLNRHLQKREEQENMALIIQQAREDHPAMGANSLYEMLKPGHLGRDRFRNWYNACGFTLHGKKNF